MGNTGVPDYLYGKNQESPSSSPHLRKTKQTNQASVNDNRGDRNRRFREVVSGVQRLESKANNNETVLKTALQETWEKKKKVPTRLWWGN